MKKNIILLHLLFLPLHPIICQVQTFALDDAISTALQNNREIKIALMTINKAGAAVDEAFGYALPSIDFSANLTHMLEKPRMPFPDFEALLTNATYNILFNEGVIPRDESKFLPVQTKLQAFAQTNSFETQAQVTQILFNSAVFRGIGASQIYLNLSKVQLQAKVAEVILNTKKAFYGVMLAKESNKIMNESLLNAEENLRNVKALYNEGFASEFDALQVEVQVENLRPKVAELKNILEDVKNKFKIVIGIKQSDSVDVLGRFDYEQKILEDAEVLYDQALKYNLDIQTLQVKKIVDEEFIAIERADYWPMLTAFGNYSYAGSSDDWNFQTYQSSMIGVSLNFNLFRGGQVANRVEQAEIATMQTEEQIHLLKDMTTSEVGNKYNEIKRIQKQIDAVTRNVDLAEKAYNIARTRYDEGTGTQLEVKNADLELRNAKINKTKFIHDYIIAKAELDKLLGKINADYLTHYKEFLDN